MKVSNSCSNARVELWPSCHYDIFRSFLACTYLCPNSKNQIFEHLSHTSLWSQEVTDCKYNCAPGICWFARESAVRNAWVYDQLQSNLKLFIICSHVTHRISVPYISPALCHSILSAKMAAILQISSYNDVMRKVLIIIVKSSFWLGKRWRVIRRVRYWWICDKSWRRNRAPCILLTASC